VSRARFLSASFMTAMTVWAVVNDFMFIAVVCFLTAGGLYEFFHMVQKKGVPIYSYIGILIGLLIPITIFTHFELTKNWELLFIVVGFLLILLLQFSREDNRNAILGLSTTLFGILYVSWFFSFLVKIRLMVPGIEGMKLAGFILLVTKSGDIGAFLIGSRLGRHPLLPKVSPHKSVEGSIGALLFSTLTAVACRSFLPAEAHFPFLQVVLMGAFFGGIGQLGDLSESLIKRDCGVKDSGRLLPGLGGVLDMIDSVLFAAPAFYLYMSSTLNSISY